MEAYRRKVTHAPTRATTRWRVEELSGEKIGAWRCVDHRLMSGFLLVDSSGPDAPVGGVANRRWSSHWKSSPEKFPSSQGGMMAAKDSRDEGGWQEWDTTIRWVVGFGTVAKP